METTVATSIGLGIPHERKFVGLFYVAGKTAHASNLDSCIQVDIDRTPVVEQDGEYVAIESSPDRHDQVVELCERCTPLSEMDFDWHKDAACYNTALDLFFDRTTASDAIEEYCNQCPVIRECLEAGALLDKQNATTVWGGIYFPKERGKRLEAIDEQRQALAHRA